MAASEAAMRAVMEALGSSELDHERDTQWVPPSTSHRQRRCMCGEVFESWSLWAEHRLRAVAVAAADAAVDADRASIQAEALREAAAIGSLRFAATHTGRGARGWNVVEAKWLRARASEIEAQP